MIYSQFLENATDADSGISVEPCVMTATVTLDTRKKIDSCLPIPIPSDIN